MRKLAAALILTSFTLPLHSARPIASPGETAAPKAAAEKAAKPDKPAADSPAKSRSLFQRMFGSKPKATPTPAPAPEAKRRPKPKTKPAPNDMPVEATTKAPVKPTPKPAETPETGTAASKTKANKGGVKKPVPAVVATPVDDATKFKDAKSKALQDAKITDLKSKADGEVDEAAAAKALSTYNRALFQKIREIDPSVGDYATKVEHALTKRVSGEKPKP